MRNVTRSETVNNYNPQLSQDTKTIMPEQKDSELSLEDSTRVVRAVANAQERFPEKIQVDDCKLDNSTDGTLARAMETKKDGAINRHIAVSNELIEAPDWLLQAAIAHEMAHIYFYQNGYNYITDEHPMFEWVCGRVYGIQTNFNGKDHLFMELIVPFLKEEDAYGDIDLWD